MNSYLYSKWDGSEPFLLDKEDLMAELQRNLMAYGDLSHALWKMQRDGILGSQGQRLPSLQDLLQRLRQRRQSQLNKYNLGSIMNDIRQRLDNILKAERQGIQRRLDEARQKAKEETIELSQETQQKLLKMVGLPTVMAERCEGLEQLRALDSGITMYAAQVSQTTSIGVDTPDDIILVEKAIKEHGLE